jgi:hypothetical protein
MEFTYYLPTFQKISDRLAMTTLTNSQLEIKAGIWVQSAVIKLQKKNWANEALNSKPSGPAIFFSVWISNKSIKEHQILYNIHALKLRKIKGYKITSREFAAAFRKNFKPFEHEWPNVSTAFGPLTLMEGWEKLDPGNYEEVVVKLVNLFLKIDFIIDNLLEERKKRV